ncbi:MAG TPA: CHC2 zinc finger domain-containing protein [Candidatus Obscuribacterales bacterium]
MNNAKTATANTWIHQNTVDRVKDIPITQIAESFGLNLKKTGAGFVALCPFHDEKTPSFTLTDGEGFYCFGCGENGGSIKLFQKLSGIENFRESIEEMASKFNINIEYDERNEYDSDHGQWQSTPKTHSKQVTKPREVKPLSIQIKIATFPEVPTNKAQRISFVLGGFTEVKTIYQYSENQWVERIERYNADGNRTKFKLGKRKEDYKHITPYHVNSNGETEARKGDAPWNLYRFDDVVEHGKNKFVLMVEGESCVETARDWGIVATTVQGAKSKDDVARAVADLAILNTHIIYFGDNDNPGQKYAQNVLEACQKYNKNTESEINCIVIDPLDFWPEMPEGGDIVDFKKAYPDMNRDEFIERLEIAIHAAVERRNTPQQSEEEDSQLQNEPIEFFGTEITQAAFQFLYGDKPWICVNGNLCEWTGTHYKKREDVTERKRIANYLNKYCVGKKFPYAKPGFISQVLDWAKSLLGIHPDEAKPSGLNCSNGILKINWESKAPNLHPVPQFELIPHSPDHFFLYDPVITFDPNADSHHCDKMLEALEPEQQDIFLKTIGASLDLSTVRRYKGRSIKALLCKGHGSNGKDTLREAVAALYGYHGMTGAGLDDFAQYDSGRKFPLAKLIHSRVNWASENGNAASLDRLQSLKAAITGDTLSHERKGENESEFSPQTVFLFNINDVPRLGAALEAIKSRFAVLSFDKTYKIGADKSAGEIEADSRFKYDPEWVKTNVLPAFLNKVLQGLTDLMTNGIDYTSTEKALDDIRCQNSHLWQFVADSGLSYSPDSTLSAQELWDKLEDWYITNGTLTYETLSTAKKKAIWEEPMNKSDKLIKSKNNIIAGFLKIFPKAFRVVIDVKNGKTGIKGLCFTPPGTLRVRCGYDDGYENPYTEGLPGTSGTISKLRAQEENINISPASIEVVSVEIENEIAKSYPTYPEPLQDKENPTRQDTRNVPAEPQNIPDKATYFDKFDVGDLLISNDNKFELHLIIERVGQLWKSHTGEYISRDNLNHGVFRQATLADMVTVVGIAYIRKYVEQARWLIDTFSSDPLSLFNQALRADDRLKVIYELVVG